MQCWGILSFTADIGDPAQELQKQKKTQTLQTFASSLVTYLHVSAWWKISSFFS